MQNILLMLTIITKLGLHVCSKAL
ncbi:unnamed protein product [Spirodela intermedia]|uniref:Uncharacterized protein n=1 Tax=Spirodela intermedia TaxID=51605 RepID=A0A7I8L3H4_SPIIN|nr:unnamed protein product [Spirodela intermedia]